MNRQIHFVLIILLSMIISAPLLAQTEGEESKEPAYKEGQWRDDMFEALSWMFKGSYLQFTQKSNLGYALVAAPSLSYSFDHDKRISGLYQSKSIPKHIDMTGDIGIGLNAPIIPIGSYIIGAMKGDSKLMNFAKEYAAAFYLTVAEVELFSWIHIHDRPNTVDISFWETEFRGPSSFPSGHIVPYTVLFFKTLQFYGPLWSIIPGVLSYWSSYQRMQEGRHWFSDIVGAFFLSAFASEGVRAAANKGEHYHPIYRWIFTHNFRVIPWNRGRMGGLSVAWNF